MLLFFLPIEHLSDYKWGFDCIFKHEHDGKKHNNQYSDKNRTDKNNPNILIPDNKISNFVSKCGSTITKSKKYNEGKENSKEPSF